MMTEPLRSLLRETSRSFYLTLRALPAGVRPQIGLAYLLARTTDTIADTELVPVEQRLAALGALRERISGRSSARLEWGELSRRGVPAERALLERIELSLAVLERFSAADRALIRQVLTTITSGQELDLRIFSKASAQELVALADGKALDDYTYRVAGCVGEFWTWITRAHCFPLARLDMGLLLERGARFGKGLQLVNILRDLPRDLQQGRCYLPGDELGARGLRPADLLRRENEGRARAVYDRWLDCAQAHLAAGWEYTHSLPWRQARLRLACAWPAQIGWRTIQRLRAGKVLDPGHRIKVTRGEVKGMILKSLLLYPFPGAWKGMIAGADLPAAPVPEPLALD